MENNEKDEGQRQEIGRTVHKRKARGKDCLRKGQSGRKDERWNTAGGKIKQRGRRGVGARALKKHRKRGMEREGTRTYVKGSRGWRGERRRQEEEEEEEGGQRETKR